MLAQTNKNNITISQVTNLSESLMKDCYYVLMQSMPLQADAFYYHAQRDVNRDNHILFVAQTPAMVVGVLKGCVDGIKNVVSEVDVSMAFQGRNLNARVIYDVFAKIDTLCVDRQYQRGGIGKSLLQAYEDFVRSRYGVNHIKLQTTSGASRFYKNNGYMGNVYMQKILTR